MFFLIAGGGVVGWLLGGDISLADYLVSVATAGGLLGVGHSVHRGAKHMARARESEARR